MMTAIDHSCFMSGFLTGLSIGGLAGAWSVIGVLYIVYKLFKLYIDRN